VDTGLGPPHPFIDQHYRPERTDLPDALREVGIGMNDVAAIVTSHLHFDHCGGNSLFPGIPIHVQRDEREAARAERYTIPEFVDFPGAAYALLEGDTEIAPGVMAISTPGHTPGHQAVRIETDDGLVVIGGQAADNAGELDPEVIQSLPDGPVRTARLRLLEGDPVRIYLGHDRTVTRPGARL
jgi:glyoxylase-like metal-dependent hydrolase (beta-lactamase superfamily II)